jgi:hypothetical protein
MRKARGDSRLKTLDAEKQGAIIRMMEGGVIEDVVERVRSEFGVETSKSALSEFWGWFWMGRQLEEAGTLAEEVRQSLSEMPELRLKSDEVMRAAQAVFELRAVKAGDDKLFLGLLSARQRDEDLRRRQAEMELAERRVEVAEESVRLERERMQRQVCEEFLRWRADARALEIADRSGVENSERIAQLGQLMFGEAWEKQSLPANHANRRE